MPKDNKPRGRMSGYAFFVQACREEHKKKHPGEAVVFTEFSRKCAERWKTMNDKEKKRFQEMADKDKIRYDQEMKHYVPPKGQKKGKQKKDPNAPKRAMSAFFWMSNERRPQVRADNPEWSVADVAKQLGRVWGEMSDKQKEKYEEMSKKDRLRYERDMKAYREGAAAAAAEDDDDDDDEEEDSD